MWAGRTLAEECRHLSRGEDVAERERAGYAHLCACARMYECGCACVRVSRQVWISVRAWTGLAGWRAGLEADRKTNVVIQEA
jgi:hypothetical protein